MVERIARSESGEQLTANANRPSSFLPFLVRASLPFVRDRADFGLRVVVWTVKCLENGDIAVGSSDAIVRVFTRKEERVADLETLTVRMLNLSCVARR